MITAQKKKSYITIFLFVIAVFALLTFFSSSGVISRYWQSILVLVCINIIMAVSLNITVGNLGQITLGHAGFMSIGAYTAGLLMKGGAIAGLPGYIISLIAAGLLAAAFGVAIGLPVLRLKGDYLAIVTLAFGEIIRVVAENLEITGGAQGLAGIPRMNDIPIIFLVTAFCIVVMYSTMTSRHGRAVLAIKDNEIAAQSSGVKITRYKTFAFTFSAFFAGVAGAIYAQNIGVISADVFNYNKSFDILVMVVLGGMGSFTGAILSSTVLTILPELLRGFADWRMIIYSIILILVMIFRPEGLMGRSEFNLEKVFSRKRGGKNASRDSRKE